MRTTASGRTWHCCNWRGANQAWLWATAEQLRAFTVTEIFNARAREALGTEDTSPEYQEEFGNPDGSCERANTCLDA